MSALPFTSLRTGAHASPGGVFACLRTRAGGGAAAARSVRGRWKALRRVPYPPYAVPVGCGR